MSKAKVSSEKPKETLHESESIDESLVERAIIAKILQGKDIDLIFREVNQKFFFVLKNRLIFQVASVINANNVQPDLVSIVSELENQDCIYEVGGIEYIASINNGFVTELTDTKNLINEIRNRYFNAFSRNIFGKTSQYLSYNTLNPQDILNIADKVNRTIIGEVYQKDDDENLDDVIRNAMKKAREGRGKLIDTRIPKLDELLGGGVERGEYIIIGARPGGGKSALALDFAVSTALGNGYAMFCATEMEQGQIALRALSKISNVPMRRLTGAEEYQNANEEEIVEKGINLLGKSKLMIYDNLTTCSEIIAEYKRQRSLGKDIRVLVVDYIQQLQPDKETAKLSQYEQLKNISNRLMRLAVDEGITVVCCSQLKRGSSPYDAPDLGDMLGSGAIEQDATKVLTLGWVKNEPFSVKAYLIKNRSGRTGKIKLKFYGACYSFWDDENESIENL